MKKCTMFLLEGPAYDRYVNLLVSKTSDEFHLTEVS